MKLHIIFVVRVRRGNGEVDKERIRLQYKYQPLYQYVQYLLTRY